MIIDFYNIQYLLETPGNLICVGSVQKVQPYSTFGSALGPQAFITKIIIFFTITYGLVLCNLC